MTNSKDKQPQSSTELRDLTDYHWQRRAAALKEAEEMSKHPLSLEELRAQVARNKAIREKNRIQDEERKLREQNRKE